jgi:hypothetical protein
VASPKGEATTKLPSGSFVLRESREGKTTPMKGSEFHATYLKLFYIGSYLYSKNGGFF